jgi:release factor glutamine methyltransferase
MTIKQALQSGAKKLQTKKISSADLDAEILLAFVLKKNRIFLYSYSEKQLTNSQKIAYQKLIAKRSAFHPIAYLTGYKEFYGYDFIVNKNVLIPRPLTEELVEKALASVEKNNLKNIVDVGTGSGCIIISLVNELKKKYGSLNNFKFYAVDAFDQALLIAKKNAKLHGLQKNIRFIKGNLLEPLKNKQIDLILANLPYLTKNDIKKNPYLKAEPKKALYEKTSGKLIYKKLFFQAYKFFDPKPTIIYEDKKGTHRK